MAEGVNYDESRVPMYILPDPLTCEDGRKIRNAHDWRAVRRPEIVRLFQESMYGCGPDLPSVDDSTEACDIPVLGGAGLRRMIRLALTPPPQSVMLDVMVILPRAGGRRPCFVNLNFFGNHSVTRDPSIPLTDAWYWNHEVAGVTDHRPTEASRGCESEHYPLHLILSRGYALATACCAQIEADHPQGWESTVRGRMQQRSGYPAYRWATISAWAWGMQCIVDHLLTVPEIDATRLAAIGHSRLGKTALWAAALDERIAMAISNDSGQGGAAITRRCFGETILAGTDMFPHWYLPRLRQYAGREQELPVDQHELIALMAPRPTYIASASEDLWADPYGEFLSGVHAQDVYGLYGKTGLGTTQWPAPNTPIGQTIGYHLRTGRHNLTSYDWEQYLNFTDRHFKLTSG
jgi:hypothetical protein